MNIIAEIKKAGPPHFLFLLFGFLLGLVLGVCLDFFGSHKKSTVATGSEENKEQNYHYIPIENNKDFKGSVEKTKDPSGQSNSPYGCDCNNDKGQPTPNGGVNPLTAETALESSTKPPTGLELPIIVQANNPEDDGVTTTTKTPLEIKLSDSNTTTTPNSTTLTPQPVVVNGTGTKA